MPRFLRRSTRAAGRLPRPRLLPRLSLLVVSVSILVLLAASFAGHPADIPAWLDPSGIVEWVVTRVRYATAGVGALFGEDPTAAAGVGARVEFFLVAVAVLMSLRWTRFWWLTVRPGPIEVALLEDATGDDENSATYVTMMLREKLSSVTVYLPTPAPGDAVGGGFLQTMRESTKESWWATVIEFVTRIIPRTAYRVDGAVLHRGDRYGVSVRVTIFPRRRTVANTVWADTQEEAAARAARVVGAAVLPLTRRCLVSPWRHWYGRGLPAELLDEYEAASAYREQRRYDEALGRYRAALDRDSLNPLIRFEIAQIQEQLGLYLDALATYAGAVALWSGSPERYDTWLHGLPGRRFPWRQRLGRWRRYGNPFLTRFRYATALAYVEKLTEQWIKPDGRDPRGRERTRLRQLLQKTLAERYGPVWRDDEPMRYTGRNRADELWQRLRDLTEAAQQRDGAAKLQLSRLFLLMSRYELTQLVRDHRGWLGWVDDSDLTTRSLRLARDSWLDVRLRVAEADGAETGQDPLFDTIADRVDRAMRTSGIWAEHYNAACVYAQILVLLGHDPEHRRFAQRAVKELFTGLEQVDSSQVSRQRSWILSEDADLRALRLCGEFQPFAAAIGPAGGAVVLRPKETQIAELGQYQVRMLSECARTMEARWHARQGDDVWAEEDGHAWWQVHQLAVGHRHWPDRLAAITYFRDRPDGTPRWDVALPDIATFSPPDADREDDRIDTWARDLIRRDNLCEILVAVWIRGHFRLDVAARKFRCNPTDSPLRWLELRELVTRAQAVRKHDAALLDGARRIIEKANEVLAQPPPDVTSWEDQAWQWAEEQRLSHPNDTSPMTETTRYALARVYAALALAYAGVGDPGLALTEAHTLLDAQGS